MRAALALLLALSAPTLAVAQEEEVLVWGSGSQPAVGDWLIPYHYDMTGPVVQPDQPFTYLELLYLNKVCPFNDDMRVAWKIPGLLGCWAPTVDGTFLFVTNSGIPHAELPYWKALAHGVMAPDGTVTVTALGESSEQIDRERQQGNRLQGPNGAPQN